MIPKMRTDIRQARLPARIEPKYDGEFCVWDYKRGVLVNRFGTTRALPFCSRLPKATKVMGELYWGDGKRNFYEALSHLKRNDPALNFVVFGVYDLSMPYDVQLGLLKRLDLPKEGQVKMIEGSIAVSMGEVEALTALFSHEGYEGSVVKPLPLGLSHWIKVKPFQTIDLAVLGIVKNKNSVSVGVPNALPYGHIVPKGDLLDALGNMAIVGTDKEHYLVNPSVVVEVRHLGFIISNGKISLRSPQFERVRYDLSPQDIDKERGK